MEIKQHNTPNMSSHLLISSLYSVTHCSFLRSHEITSLRTSRKMTHIFCFAGNSLAALGVAFFPKNFINYNMLNPLNSKVSEGSAHANLNYQPVKHYNTVPYTNSHVSCMKLCCYHCCVAMVASCKQYHVAGRDTGLSGIYDIVLGRKTGLYSTA